MLSSYYVVLEQPHIKCTYIYPKFEVYSAQATDSQVQLHILQFAVSNHRAKLVPYIYIFYNHLTHNENVVSNSYSERPTFFRSFTQSTGLYH